jgi:hypothetical protein
MVAQAKTHPHDVMILQMRPNARNIGARRDAQPGQMFRRA